MYTFDEFLTMLRTIADEMQGVDTSCDESENPIFDGLEVDFNEVYQDR